MEALNLDGHFATNVTGAWKCAKACFPFLKKNKKGIIINVSSRRGTFNFNKDYYERANPYKISKCALNMMSLLMDQEFSHEGIRVFPVHPGALKTRVAPPDADTTPEQAAEKLFSFINTIDQDTSFGLYDIIKDKYLEW
jgi:NAD(P)-dependent dehydrogenase (short-subunit alcohol dehydrogenase family)